MHFVKKGALSRGKPFSERVVERIRNTFLSGGEGKLTFAEQAFKRLRLHSESDSKDFLKLNMSSSDVQYWLARDLENWFHAAR